MEDPIIIITRKAEKKEPSEEEQKAAIERYNNVMKYIIRRCNLMLEESALYHSLRFKKSCSFLSRYITNEQRKSEDTSITEDDIQEVR